MINISANISGHALMLWSPVALPTGSIAVDQLELAQVVGEEWAVCATVTAQFWIKPSEIYEAEFENNVAVIPQEVLSGVGLLHIAVYGSDAAGTKRISTNTVTMPITQGSFTEASAPAPSASMFEQAVSAAVEEVKDEILAPSAAIDALLALLKKVAYIDEHGQNYIDDFEDALKRLTSITAVFTQGTNVIYDTDTLDDLKQYLVVTAHYSDNSTATVTDYALSGTLTAGTSTITVSYRDKTATFTVTVTATATGDPISSTNQFVMTENPAGSTWNSTTKVGTINANGTTAYPGCCLQNLLYTWSQVKTKTVIVEFDYIYTGHSSGLGVLVGVGSYQTATPTNNSSGRYEGKTIIKIEEDGTGHFTASFDLSTIDNWASSADNGYFGAYLMNNANAGCTLKFSNFTASVVG